MNNLEKIIGTWEYCHLMREANEFNQKKNEKKDSYKILLNDEWDNSQLVNLDNDNGKKQIRTADVVEKRQTNYLNINTTENVFSNRLNELFAIPKMNESVKNVDRRDGNYSSIDVYPNFLAKYLYPHNLEQQDYSMPNQSFDDKNRPTNILYTKEKEQLPPPLFTTKAITIPNTSKGFYNDDRIDPNIPLWDNPDVVLVPVQSQNYWQQDYCMPNTSYIEPQEEDPREHLDGLAFVYAEEATINELKEIEKLTKQKELIELQILLNENSLNTPRHNIVKRGSPEFFLPICILIIGRKN